MQLKRLVSAVAFCAFSVACGWLYPEPSAVAQGEYYASGNPSFDEFFIKLHRFQVELAAAPDGARQVRADIAKTLGLGADAADDQIEIRLKEEAHKLAEGGMRMKLEVPESTEQGSDESSVTVRTSKNPFGDGELFVSGIQASTTKLLRIRNRMRLGHKELEGLRVQGIELDGQVDTAFRKESPWKRDEVRENIADGQKLITLMIARSDEVGTESDKLLEVVARAATTDEKLGAAAVSAPPPPPPEPASDDETGDKSKNGKAKKSKPARPASKSRPAAARPTPKPTPASGDDSEPAPAPKPPPAEAAPKEFEP